jgi:hypothetical protein
MKRGFKALAVLAAAAVAIAGPASFAVCIETGGFAIFQCADRAFFSPAPAGAGSVSAAFWQIGYGNKTLDTNQGTSGTGMSTLATFNGNDNGTWAIDLIDAQVAIGDTAQVPAGALCLRSNNWANNGFDGCCDNPRDAALLASDDGLLNPVFDVNAVLNYSADPNVYPSTDWVQDSPIGALLRESSGHFFAVAAVATQARMGPGDIRVGAYNFRDVSTAGENPFNPSEHNIVPWQRIPGDKDPLDPNSGLVRQTAFADPNDKLHSTRILQLGWTAATVHSDDSSRPSTNAQVPSGGMGTNQAEAGDLVRYVVEIQPISDANQPFNLNPNGWTALGTAIHPPATGVQVQVPPDNCIRLHTYFGKDPQVDPNGWSVAQCRLGLCGDLGVDVVSPPACLGGPLVSESPIGLVVGRARGVVNASWKTSAELTIERFDVFAVTKGGPVKIATVPCKSCTGGVGSTYSVALEMKKLAGARQVEVVAVGPGSSARAAIK